MSVMLKGLAILLHSGGLVFFLVLMSLLQNPEAHIQYPTLAGFVRSYAAAYNLGGFLALMTLLSVAIPSLFNPRLQRCEIISSGRLVFLTLMLLILCMAYSIRTPIPPGGYSDYLGIGYLALSKPVQFASTYFIGVCTAILGLLAVFRIWPRMLIILSMMYLVYFFSGDILFNTDLKQNLPLLLASFGFVLLMLSIGIVALAILRPAEPNKPETSENPLSNMGAASDIETLPMEQPTNSAQEPLLTETYKAREVLAQLRSEINNLRQEHYGAEMQRLEQLNSAINDLQKRVENTAKRR